MWKDKALKLEAENIELKEEIRQLRLIVIDQDAIIKNKDRRKNNLVYLKNLLFGKNGEEYVFTIVFILLFLFNLLMLWKFVWFPNGG